MALVVLLRGLNVGGQRTFRPTDLAEQLRHLASASMKRIPKLSSSTLLLASKSLIGSRSPVEVTGRLTQSAGLRPFKAGPDRRPPRTRLSKGSRHLMSTRSWALLTRCRITNVPVAPMLTTSDSMKK
jgi:hypothetical protein